jgi:hypothetical protein
VEAADGEPVAGARVSAREEASGAAISTAQVFSDREWITDAAGRFEIRVPGDVDGVRLTATLDAGRRGMRLRVRPGAADVVIRIGESR